jgi:hypothetical protein
MLNPTPVDQLVDEQNRPYFMPEMTLDRFQKGLRDSNPEARAYLIGKLMREARPDDVFSFVSPQQIAEIWDQVEIYLGSRRRDFWDWLFTKLEEKGIAWRR